MRMQPMMKNKSVHSEDKYEDDDDSFVSDSATSSDGSESTQPVEEEKRHRRVNTDIEERNQFADQFNIDKIQKDDDENVFAKRYEDSTDEESEEMEKDKRRNKMDVNIKDSLNDFDEMDDSEINIVSDTKARGSNEFDSEDSESTQPVEEEKRHRRVNTDI